MDDAIIRLEVDPLGIATLTLNRPDVHNAFDDTLIARMTEELRRLDANANVRAVILAAAGKSFSAGADLNWMKRVAAYSEADNVRDALALAGLMRTLNTLSKPTIARVQGAAFGGGVGLVACCDIALASASAVFSLSEVKLGMIPSVISPYVIAAMGSRNARRYFMTGERFDAHEALRIGLVHEVTDVADLDAAVAKITGELLKAGPLAVAAAKDLIAHVERRPIDQALSEETAKRIARIRVSPEGQEGIAAFLDKRAPSWTTSTPKA